MAIARPAASTAIRLQIAGAVMLEQRLARKVAPEEVKEAIQARQLEEEK